MLKKHIKKRSVRLPAAVLVADGLFFGLVNPHQAPAIMLMAGYLLLAVTVLGAVQLIVQALRWYGGDTQRIGKQVLHYGAAALLLVIALQSTGQLTIRDIMTLVPLTILAFWYFGLRRPQPVPVRVERR